jgi:hypothetical protein
MTLEQTLSRMFGNLEAALTSHESRYVEKIFEEMRQLEVTIDAWRGVSAREKLRSLRERYPRHESTIDSLDKKWVAQCQAQAVANGRAYKCQGCSKVMPSTKKAEHEKECSSFVTCGGCDMRILRKDLLAHEQTCRLQLKCPGCDSETSTRAALRQHVQNRSHRRRSVQDVSNSFLSPAWRRTRAPVRRASSARDARSSSWRRTSRRTRKRATR